MGNQRSLHEYTTQPNSTRTVYQQEEGWASERRTTDGNDFMECIRLSPFQSAGGGSVRSRRRDGHFLPRAHRIIHFSRWRLYCIFECNATQPRGRWWARIVTNHKRALAVHLGHPDWDDQCIAEEVGQIMSYLKYLVEMNPQNCSSRAQTT